MTRATILLLAIAATQAAANPWREAALALPARIDRAYAYPERLSNGRFVLTPALEARAATVETRSDLVRFAEDSLALLADHHAITGASNPDSWGLVPSYADIWIERQAGVYRVTDVRADSPADQAGLGAGTTLISVGGIPAAAAVEVFWLALGVPTPTDDQAAYAARVLAAGRRDRPRTLEFGGPGGARRLVLPNLYAQARAPAPVLAIRTADGLLIRVNDSLGDSRTIASFDTAMASARPGEPVILDLTDTPSGGTSTVARAIMGWFTDRARPYQVHRAIAEERETGIPRQWIEQVLPRPGRFHTGPVSVRVGRWTGSMGEGIAIGLAGWGIDVAGRPMAGLKGAIADINAGPDGFVIKLPTERLMAVDGTPREDFRPRALAPGKGD